MKKIIILLSVLAVTTAVWAGMPDKPHTGSTELEKLKTLTGDWTGTMQMGEEQMPMTVSYRTTGAGSAVVETWNAGTPMKMVSIYHDKDGKLFMTHYCALGNQPQMMLQSSDDSSVTLAMVGADGVDDAKDMHMHGVVISFKDEGTIEHNWDYWENGASSEKHGGKTLVLTRK